MFNNKKIITLFLLGAINLSFTACNSSDTDNFGESPVITLEGPTDINISLGTTTILEDGDRYSAMDEQDGDLTHAVERTHDIDFSKAGTYRIKYYVEDSDSYSDTKYRTVTIASADYQPYTGTVSEGSVPVISYTDGQSDSLFVALGETVNLYAVKATDFEDGDLTGSIIITSDIDTNTAGVYTINYSVTDSNGNTVTRERTVYVGQNDFGTQIGDSDIESFKSWYASTCGQTFNDSLYTPSTGQYNGTINCSNSNLTDIDLTSLSIFSTIRSLNLSHNNLSYIDFNQLDLSVNNVKVLEDLDISHNNLSDKSMFDPLHNLRNINNLWIQGNNFDYSSRADREALYRTFNNKSLTIYF